MKHFSEVVYAALTLAVCLLAVVNALPPALLEAVEEPHAIPGDGEQSSANEEDINGGKWIKNTSIASYMIR